MSIGRNATYNMIGYVLPTLLAVVTVPAYLHLIGAARYGVLAIAWLILGYFGLFDLGLGRATTQRIAALREASAHDRAVALDTAIATNIGIGLVGGLILWPVAWYMFARSMDMAPALRAEAVAAAPLLGLAVPVATSMGVLSGALMGRERFLQTNRISVTSTALFQLFPLAVAWLFGPNLVQLLIASIAARCVGLVMLWFGCRREFGAVSGRLWDRAQLRSLLAYGGWVTLTSMFGPLLVFADRFMIGTLVGAVAVTVYVVPMEATRRLVGIATSVSTTLFPRLAVASGEESFRLSGLAIGALYALLTPPVMTALFAMDPIMRLWIGQEIGHQSASLARLFVVAWWFNGLGQIAYTRLQAQGRPDLVSKIILAETPLYLFSMWWALTSFGLWGAVCVFLARVVVDTTVMSLFASRRFAHGRVTFATLAVFIAISVWLRERPITAWAPAIATGAVATVLCLWPCWRVAPPQLWRIAKGAMSRISSVVPPRLGGSV